MDTTNTDVGAERAQEARKSLALNLEKDARCRSYARGWRGAALEQSKEGPPLFLGDYMQGVRDSKAAYSAAMQERRIYVEGSS